MSARRILKSAAPIVAHYSGLGKALAWRYGGIGVIFMLHSTVGETTPYLEDIRCPTGVLERSLRWLKNAGFAFVSLDEAVRRLGEARREKFCAFTFDDGYADNLTHALPVMERFAAPFTVYVTTGMMTGEVDAWWFGLAKLVRDRDRIELPDLNRRFECSDHASKRRTYGAIEEIVHQNYDTLDPIKRVIATAGIDYRAQARQEGLTREQLRDLASSPLVTIGAHTERHINLARASAEEVGREMTGSRRTLEDILQREVVHFAYPFGNVRACGPREAQIAGAAGFHTAVTCRRGMLFPEHRDHLHALPREPLDGSDTPARLHCKVRGVNRALQTLFGDPIALM